MYYYNARVRELTTSHKIQAHFAIPLNYLFLLDDTAEGYWYWTTVDSKLDDYFGVLNSLSNEVIFRIGKTNKHTYRNVLERLLINTFVKNDDCLIKIMNNLDIQLTKCVNIL